MSLWVSGRVAQRDERLGNESFIQVERFADHLWAEEWRAHPTAIQAQVEGHQQQILDGSANALDGHSCLIGLPPLIGIAIQVFQEEAGNNDGRRVEYALARFFHAQGYDFLALPIHLQLPPPAVTHTLGKLLFDRLSRQDYKAPGLPPMR